MINGVIALDICFAKEKLESNPKTWLGSMKYFCYIGPDMQTF